MGGIRVQLGVVPVGLTGSTPPVPGTSVPGLGNPGEIESHGGGRTVEIG